MVMDILFYFVYWLASLRGDRLLKEGNGMVVWVEKLMVLFDEGGRV